MKYFPALSQLLSVMPVTIKELNTLTLIYDAYYDFGLIGVFLEIRSISSCSLI